MRNKLKWDKLVSIICILEAIAYLLLGEMEIIKLEWWYPLYTNLGTIFLYIIVYTIRCKIYVNPYNLNLFTPVFVMIISQHILGIFLIIITGAANINSEVNIVALTVLIAMQIIFLFCPPILMKKFDILDSFIKTEDGVKLQCKMAGLKNYIKDFSQLEEKNLKDIIIWEEYLIYSIIFDLKGDLDKDAKHLYYMLTKEI